jgi:hypothetical protein
MPPGVPEGAVAVEAGRIAAVGEACGPARPLSRRPGCTTTGKS